MRNLLYANSRRNLLYLPTYLLLLGALFFGIVFAGDAVQMRGGVRVLFPDDGCVQKAAFVIVLYFVFLHGREQSGLSVHNRIIAGYSKVQIWISEVLAALAVVLIACTLFLLPLRISASPFLAQLPPHAYLYFTAGILLAVLSVVMLTLIFAMMIPNPLGAACGAFTAFILLNRLNESAFFSGKTLRDLRHLDLFQPMINCCHALICLPDSAEGAEARIQLVTANYGWQIGILAVILLTGGILFKHKQLK